jgi:predicted ATPase
MKGAVKSITIRGFKSIRNLEGLELTNLNVVIGANGAGKSNLVQVFQMLRSMTLEGFQKFIGGNGGADSFLHNGPKHTEEIYLELEFESGSPAIEGSNFYKCQLTPTVSETFLVEEYRRHLSDGAWRSYGSPSQESRLREMRNEAVHSGEGKDFGYFVYGSISSWVVYHFHDTGPLSPMRRSEIVEDNQVLRHDASNIAPFLRELRSSNGSHYQEILNGIRLVLPFFDDFLLDIVKQGEAEKTKLTWSQKGSDFPMQPYHLSDGSLRFICLVTALLQPKPPSTIVIDEPELGLHPEAIRILGELIRDASNRTQLIVATQSPLLIDQFSIEDIVVVNREGGQSTFQRLELEDFDKWLDNYSVGELWTKNVIKAGTNHE